MSALHLTVATPAALLVDALDVVSLRAADLSGSFGLLPGHADFLTVLPATVVQWRRADGTEGFCAVRGGVLTCDGARVAVACRRGVLGASLDALEDEVHAARDAAEEAARQAPVEQMRLHARAVRQLMKYLRPGRADGGNGAWPRTPVENPFGEAS